MAEANAAAVTMLGLSGFVVLAVTQTDGEIETAVETTTKAVRHDLVQRDPLRSCCHPGCCVPMNVHRQVHLRWMSGGTWRLNAQHPVPRDEAPSDTSVMKPAQPLPRASGESFS